MCVRARSTTHEGKLLPPTMYTLKLARTHTYTGQIDKVPDDQEVAEYDKKQEVDAECQVSPRPLFLCPSLSPSLPPRALALHTPSFALALSRACVLSLPLFLPLSCAHAW